MPERACFSCGCWRGWRGTEYEKQAQTGVFFMSVGCSGVGGGGGVSLEGKAVGKNKNKYQVYLVHPGPLPVSRRFSALLIVLCRSVSCRGRSCPASGCCGARCEVVVVVLFSL